jgi:hypothetical protein
LVGIKICFTSIAHPRSTGKAEHANTEVLKGLKTRSFNSKLEACGKKWLDNLQSVLWSISTSATKLTGETPFFLIYGAEAVLPADVKFGSPRVLAFNELRQEDSSAIASSSLKRLGVRRHFMLQDTSRACTAMIALDDLVLRRILSREGLHKLSPMREGPFKVMHIARPSSVWLETVEDVPVGNPWNIAHLRKFYP